MMLAWTIYISFIGAVAVMLLPRARAREARGVALLAAGLGLVAAISGLVEGGEMRTLTRVSWVPGLGIEYHLAADGISVALTLLTGLAAVAGILFSWNVERHEREFFALYLTLIGGVYGVFLSFDLFLLFVFYELAIIPKYFLIAIWGSTNREYGAMKLALYSFVGSAMVLIGLVAVYVVSGSTTMNLLELTRHAHSFSAGFQQWAFPLVFIGFGVLAGLWPFHTWAPTGHVAAPTAASMLLAGVVMKLGAYGALRVALPLFPEGARFWQMPLAIMAAVGIVYGAMVALTQKDFKFVIGYSSVSHMGFVLLGMMTLSATGLSGAVLQMFSHGIIAGLLFAVVGRMVYDRTHTRDLGKLEGMGLARALPFASVTFVVASMASMGLPGFSGFVAELQVLIGAWHAFPALALLTGLGIVVGVAYTVKVLQQAFFGDSSPAETAASLGTAAPPPPLPPISVPERLGAVLLMGVTLAVGLFPQWLIQLIDASWRGGLFDAVLQGGRG